MSNRICSMMMFVNSVANNSRGVGLLYISTIWSNSNHIVGAGRPQHTLHHAEAHMHNVEALPEFEVLPSQQEIAFLQLLHVVIVFSFLIMSAKSNSSFYKETACSC